MKILTVLTALSLPTAFCAQPESDLQTSAYRNSIAQDEVRKQSEEVRQQLALLLEDIQQNQIDTPEADLARQAAAKLGSLGDEQIIPLIQMLKDAGAMDSTAQAQGKLTEASKEQKNIQILLKGMADHLSLNKDQALIQSRLEQLVLHQTTNIRQIQDVVTKGKPPEIVSLCQTEQAALRQEVDLTFDTLQKVVDGASADQMGKFAGALEEMKRQDIATLAAAASDQTSAGKFADALVSQGRLRDALQAVLMKLKSDQPAQERMEALAARMKELVAEQKALAEAAKIAQKPAQRDLGEAQRQLADQLAAVQKEVQDMNIGAAEATAMAADSMNKAAQELQEAKRPKKNEITAAQDEAAKMLEQAAEELDKAADKLAAETRPQNAVQVMTELTKLSQEIADAQAGQNALAANPSANAAQQEKLAEKAAELQQEALPISPEAAASLGEAAAQMQGENAQLAAQALSQASAKIQQQMQQVAKAAAQEQHLQALAREIAETKAQADQAQKNLQNALPGQDQMAAIRKTEEAQKSLQEAQLAASGVGTPPDVKQALQKARQALEKSKLDAAQMKKGDAMAANAAAQKSLQGAAQSLQQTMSAALAQAMPSSSVQPSQLSGTQNQHGGMDMDGQSRGGASGSKANSQDFLANAGPRGTAGQVVAGLKPKDREAVAALQGEKAPAEYQGMASQYLKNLAGGESPATPLP